MNTGVLALFVPVLWASAAAAQVYRPEVPIALVAHEGEPVPGIPGATFDGFAPPKIDAEGRISPAAGVISRPPFAERLLRPRTPAPRRFGRHRRAVFAWLGA